MDLFFIHQEEKMDKKLGFFLGFFWLDIMNIFLSMMPKKIGKKIHFNLDKCKFF